MVDFKSGGVHAGSGAHPIRASGTQMGSRNEAFHPALSGHNCGSCRRYPSELGAFLPTAHNSISQQHLQTSACSPVALESVPVLEDNQEGQWGGSAQSREQGAGDLLAEVQSGQLLRGVSRDELGLTSREGGGNEKDFPCRKKEEAWRTRVGRGRVAGMGELRWAGAAHA